MSGAAAPSRMAPTHEFRPTRATRARATVTTTSEGPAGATTGTQRRTRSTSRPPSGSGAAPTVPNGRPGGGTSTYSRPGSSVFSSGATRSTGLGPSGRSSAPGASNTTTAGVKRKSRLVNGENENEKATTAKRPALSNAFSEHLAQSSSNRQLLALKAQVTELQISVSEKQREIIRLETDLRQVSDREEEAREARTLSEEELALKTTEYETELSALKRKLVELEADHDDLSDAYSNLSHNTTSQINALRLEVSTRDDKIALLESQLRDAERRAQEEHQRAKELEEALELMEEEGPGDENEQDAEHKQEDRFGNHGRDSEVSEKERMAVRMEFKEPESSIDGSASVNANGEDQAEDFVNVDADADADGEVDPEEVSMLVDTTTDNDVTPTRDIEASSNRSGSVTEPNTSSEGMPESNATENRGITPHRDVSSLDSGSAGGSTATRSRSTSVASSAIESVVSKAMSISLDGPNLQNILRSPGTPASVASGHRLDPLSRVRRQLGHSSPSRLRSSVEISRDREKDYEIIRAELARQTSHISQLESTNARLTSEVTRFKARAEGTEVLREEKRELERRVEAMEALRARVAGLETAADEFTRREKEWQARLSASQRVTEENSSPGKTPVGVTQQLTALRKAHTTLLDEHGELKAALRVNEVELASAREDAENTARDLERLSKDVERLENSLARKEQERVLLENEASFLRSLVSSYRNEEVADISMDGGNQREGTEKLEQRIAQLELLLTQYKTTVQSLEKEVDHLRQAGGKAANKSQEEWNQLLSNASQLEEVLKNAQAELIKREERVEELEQRLFELGGEIDAGRHIPPATRVLSLRRNPAQEWVDLRQEALDRLKAENQALLARLQDLEDRGISASPSEADIESRFVPRESWEVLKKQAEEQAKELAETERRRKRLQQIYTAKSLEFREAIESILGVKFAFYPDGQVRLTSIYDLSATYVFRPSRNDPEGGMNMQLIAKGDKCPEELEGLVRMWIHDEMCIPCFMASITLECYDRWKRDQT